MNAPGRAIGRLAVTIAVPILLLVAWWFLSLDSTSIYFPPLQSILQAFGDTWLFDHAVSDALPSLGRMFSGLGIALVLGIALGVLLGRIRLLREALDPILQFGRALPATALVPVGIVLFGIGDAPKIALIALVSFFPILLSTIDGVRSIEPGLEDVARSFLLTRRQRVLSIQIPSALPNVMAGLRIGLSIAFVMMVVTELVAATNGIGFLTLRAQATFHTAEMWAGVLLLGLLGVIINGAFLLVERRILHWYTQKEVE